VAIVCGVEGKREWRWKKTEVEEFSLARALLGLGSLPSFVRADEVSACKFTD
jgi:hypothetical protein